MKNSHSPLIRFLVLGSVILGCISAAHAGRRDINTDPGPVIILDPNKPVVSPP